MSTDDLFLPEENLYLDLELFLDPPTIQFDELKNELGKKITEWNKLAVADPKYKHWAQIAETFCKRTEPPIDPEPTLTTMFKEAKEKREAAGRKTAKIYEEDGILEQTEHDALHKEFSPFFQKTTINSWLTLKPEPPFVSPKEPAYPDGVKKNIVAKSEMDSIAADLKIALGNENATIYDLLKLPPTTTLETIQNTQKAAYDKVMKKPKGDEKVNAEQRILGKAKLIFKDEFSRQGYDIAIERRSFDKLIDSTFQKRAVKKNITHEDYVKSIEEARQVGFSQTEAEWYVYDYYILKRKLPPPKRQIALPPRQQCPVCYTLNDINAKFCRCGIPLKVECPRPQCKRVGSFGDKACTQCGFALGDMPIALKCLDLAKVAITTGNIEEADDLFRQVNVYWKDAPGADALRKSLEELKNKHREVTKRIKGLETKIKDAIGKRFIYEARQLFHELRQIPEAAAYLQVEEKVVYQTIEEVQKSIVKLTSVNVLSEKIELCEQILARATDCSEAKTELGKIPPFPPENLVATVIPTGVELKWTAPAAKSLLTFIVVRKTGGTPASVSDGTRIQEGVTHPGFVDSTINIGTIYGYAVFTQRDTTIETSGCRSALVQKIEDVGNVSILPGDSSLTVSWEKQPASQGMIVTRFTGTTPTGDGFRVALQSETSFVDSNLDNGKTYCYRIQTIFRGIDGKDIVSHGKIIPAKPQVPPKAIVDLRASESGDNTLLQWTAPSHGDVLLFDLDADPGITVGTVDWTTQVELKKRYGDTIPTIDKGKVLWKNTSTGVRYILPITFHDGLAVFGNPVSVVRIADITGLDLDYIGDKLRLTWKWSKGLQKVLISYRHDQYPKGVNDSQAAKVVLNRQEYDTEKAWLLSIGNSQEHYFCIYAFVEQNAQNAYSRGVRIQTAKTAIKYELSIRRPYIYWGQIEAKLILAIASGRQEFPDMVVRQHTGKPPMNRELGMPFFDIAAQSAQKLIIPLDINQLDEDTYIRVFTKSEADAERYIIDIPPREKLHLCFKKPSLFQLYYEIINLIFRK